MSNEQGFPITSNVIKWYLRPETIEKMNQEQLQYLQLTSRSWRTMILLTQTLMTDDHWTSLNTFKLRHLLLKTCNRRIIMHTTNNIFSEVFEEFFEMAAAGIVLHGCHQPQVQKVWHLGILVPRKRMWVKDLDDFWGETTSWFYLQTKKRHYASILKNVAVK